MMHDIISFCVKVVGVAATGWLIYYAAKIITCIPRKEKAIPGKRKIACIGDSITFGMGVNWTRSRDSYPRILQEKLGPDFQVLNYGISSATLMPGTDLPYRKFNFLNHAKAVNPEYFLLMLGTNDSKVPFWNPAAYEKALVEMVQELAEVPGCKKVILMAPPAAFPKKGKTEPLYGIQDAVIQSDIHAILFRQSEKFQIPCIDLYSVTAGHPEYFSDGIHPNAQGNRIIAEAVYDELKKQLA